jgi:hypothetical protein
MNKKYFLYIKDIEGSTENKNNKNLYNKINKSKHFKNNF